ncbi:MAG: hypothetical protein Q8K55_15320 [Gemmatimonadaceae bacterium]|nr:hypothetical protein [Gemmatimonadaceae bacterium]
MHARRVGTSATHDRAYTARPRQVLAEARMKRYSIILLALIPIFWIVWGVTAKEQGSLMWGSLVTVEDSSSAALFGLTAPGAYVGTRNGTALPAVRGGLKLIFTLSDPGLGARAIRRRAFKTPAGYVFVATAMLWLLAIGAYVVASRKAPNS